MTDQLPKNSESPGQPSRTAMAVCLMRALHTRFDRPAIIDDPWAYQLLTEAERQTMISTVTERIPVEERERIIAAGAGDALLHAVLSKMSVYGGVIIRSRYAEELVQAAAKQGVKQYVLIGAGLDSFALRRPESLRDLAIFEIDHPASQAFKRSRLASCGAVLPENLHFIAADLGKEDLHAALARSAFDFSAPAIFSWLGVTVYLSREANFATFASIGKHFSPGSSLVFTYIERRALESDSIAMRRAKEMVAALGEPWITGFDPQTLPAELRDVDLEMVEDLGGDDMYARYCTGRTDGFTLGRAGRIAQVRVSEAVQS